MKLKITAVIFFLFLFGCGGGLHPLHTHLPESYPGTNAEGRLSLIAVVGNGKVTKATVEQSLADPLLAEAAKNSLLSWEFSKTDTGIYKAFFVFRISRPSVREFHYTTRSFKTEFDGETNTVTITSTKIPFD